jgi:hypothetical protein
MLAALGPAIPAGAEDDGHASLAGVRATDKSAEALLAAGSSICRFLRVSVRKPGLVTEQIAWLAHELWHAVEIARVPEVREPESLRGLYERIGARQSEGCRISLPEVQS